VYTVDSNKILSISNVTKRFLNVTALDAVSFEVQKGHVHGIIGENGAGKSTLMKILSGVYQKDEGQIIFDGQEMNIHEPMDSLKLGLSIIYQEFNLVNTMTVGENIFFARFKEIGGLKKIHKRAGELLHSIGSDIDTYTLIDNLSISEKQMVEIARALSFDSKLIIMDEPSTTLTTKEMSRLVEIINELREKGITIIYISHKLDEIYELCDRVTIMRDGHVIDNRDVAALNRQEMIAMMVGRTIENEYPQRPECVGETILQVKNFNTKKLNNISFQLKRGEILGLVGLVGAGRTEIVRALFGVDKLHSGKIWLNGKKIGVHSPIDMIRAGMGFVTEDRKEQGLFQSFSVGQNITAASIDHFSKNGILNRHKENKIAEKQIQALSVKTPSTHTKAANLSGGNQQKVIIGRWLERNPQILILDEPTRGIDVGAKYEIYLLMKQIVENGSSIIMISSELPEVLNMSNRVLVIANGEVKGEFDPLISDENEVMASALGEEDTR